MKNAPSLKYQLKDKFTEVIIFAGTDAYAHAQHWIESEGRKHGDNVPPVYTGPKQLADWRISALLTRNAVLRVSISRGDRANPDQYYR